MRLPDPKVEAGASQLHYVYLLQGIDLPDQTYVGCTADLRARLTKHNAGEVTHTSKFKPWRITAYFAFADSSRAYAFERYLKSGSGRAFSLRHFR